MSHPLNRYTTGNNLLLLFPKLEREYVDDTITRLLSPPLNELEPHYETTDFKECMQICPDSWERYSNKVVRVREEVRQRLVQELKELLARGLTDLNFTLDRRLDQVVKAITELTDKVDKLQAEASKGDKEDKIKEVLKG